MVAELRPVFATLPPSAMRMELTRLVSSKLGLSEGLAETLLASGGGETRTSGQPVSGREGSSRYGTGTERSAGASIQPSRAESNVQSASATNGDGGSRASRVLSARADTERAFLALCIATPQYGEIALGEVDLDGVFTSELLRRAAEHLKSGHLAEPLKDVDAEDRELVSLLAELTVEAGRWPVSARSRKPPMLEVQQLQLQLAWIDRRIHAARAQGVGEVSDLAKLRGEVKQDFDRAQERALAESGPDGAA